MSQVPCILGNMESPNKRLKPSPSAFEVDDDFVALGNDNDDGGQYGYGATNGFQDQSPSSGISHAPRGPRADFRRGGYRGHGRDTRNDPRNAKDKPKSKHALPGHEPWVLVKTKYGRRFVHNTESRESFWHTPKDVMPGVLEFERLELQQKEQRENAKWAEEQLNEMRPRDVSDVNKIAIDGNGDRIRRRRSESLQREDEEAMMAELAAEAEHAEEQDAKETVESLKTIQPQIAPRNGGGYDSESSYEEVEVTDSEFEDDEKQVQPGPARPNEEPAPTDQQEDGAVEFGEDDIAYQLAAMGEDYGLDQGEYGEEVNEDWDEGAEGLPLTDDDAANLFREMLDDHQISPFTPWDKLIADESEDSVLMDDRYTVLPSTRIRKAVWEAWVKDAAAKLKEERAKMEKLDPRIPYLAFLSDKATPKLYWPEFKRKYKKDVEMTDRKLSDKDREKLYRDHINRLKLPESTRKADLINLLKSMPLQDLNHSSKPEALPQQLLNHLHFVSLPASTRHQIIASHIRTLPPPP